MSLTKNDVDKIVDQVYNKVTYGMPYTDKESSSCGCASKGYRPNMSKRLKHRHVGFRWGRDNQRGMCGCSWTSKENSEKVKQALKDMAND